MLTLGTPCPSPPACSAGGLTTTCRIPARACTPFPPAQSLALQTWAGSEAAQGWGLGLRGSGVIWGYETLLQSPPPLEESLLGLGGRVSAPALKQPGAHVLHHVSRNAGELSLWPGEKRGERLQISQGEDWKEPKRPCEACAHQPPYPKSGAPGSRSRLPEPPRPGLVSPGGRERALRAIFGPNRHAPLIQAGGAGLELRERERRGRSRPKGGPGAA